MPEAEPINLKEKVRNIPHKPGVYLMKDRLGQTIYVGKAKDLKKRVSTYFQASRKLMISQPKVQAMIDLIYDFDLIIVNSEAEALLLEGQLIKQYKPRYNTVFTDDKHFLLVRVDPREDLPRFRLTRNRTDQQSRYFGPFAHATQLRKTLAELRRKFGILLGDAKPVSLGDGRSLNSKPRCKPAPKHVTMKKRHSCATVLKRSNKRASAHVNSSAHSTILRPRVMF